MTNYRTRRQSENAQSAVETALVIPALLAVLLVFVGAILLDEATNEVRSATTVATVSAFSAPAGDPTAAMSAVTDSFTKSITSSYVINPTISCPPSEGNAYLYTGTVAANTYVSCHGTVTVDFSNTPVGILWRWPVSITENAQVPVPLYRQCAQAVTTC